MFASLPIQSRAMSRNEHIFRGMIYIDMIYMYIFNIIHVDVFRIFCCQGWQVGNQDSSARPDD